MAALTTVTFVIGFYTFISEPHPHSIAFEAVQRIANTTKEVYRLEVVNSEKGHASHIKMSIVFPFQNTTIYKIDKSQDEVVLNETGGVDKWFYTVEFEKCRENQLLVVFVFVENKDFNPEDSTTVLPDTKVWTDEEGEIDITYLKNEKFVY